MNHRARAVILVVVALAISTFLFLRREDASSTRPNRESSSPSESPRVTTQASREEPDQGSINIKGEPENAAEPTRALPQPAPALAMHKSDRGATGFVPKGMFGGDGIVRYAALEALEVPIDRARELQDLIVSYRQKLALLAREHTREIEYRPIVKPLEISTAEKAEGLIPEGPGGPLWMKNTDVVFEIAPFDSSRLLADFSAELNDLLGREIADNILPHVSRAPPFTTLGRYEIVVGFTTDQRRIPRPSTKVTYELRAAKGGRKGGYGITDFTGFTRGFGNVFAIDEAASPTLPTAVDIPR